jgi:serine phosphatase RsbU (regulator of sigma subunit)
MLRLTTVVERQRQDIARLRAESAAHAVVATASGLLMERLGCTAAEAARQLGILASATGVPMAEMAATVLGTPPGEPDSLLVAGNAGGNSAGGTGAAGTAVGGTGTAESGTAESGTGGTALGAGTALAADGASLVEMLAGQVTPLGADTLVMWLLAPDGALELLGSAGLGDADASRWRHLPPQLDCPAQRVAQGASDVWWPAGRPADDRTPVTPPADAARAVLALRERHGELLGVLEIRWTRGPTELTESVREQLTSLAAGCAPVLAARLAHGELAAAQPRQALFALLDQLATSVLVVRAIRDDGGTVSDFAIDHMSSAYIDPAGRPAGELSGRSLLEVYPVTVAGHRLFNRALAVLESGEPQYLPGPLIEPVPLAHFRAAKFYDGVIFTWRAYGEASGLTDLLDHVQRLGKLGGWAENLVTGTVRWTDSAFGIFGLTPEPGAAIRLADLPSYVVAADKAAMRRFCHDLPAERPLAPGDAITTTFRIVRPDDSSIRQIRVFAEPVADVSGTVVALRGAFQDVSAHYLTQVALDATRDQLADSEQRAAEEHRLALRLQHAIMPPDALPVEASGIDIAVRYRPAGRGHLVGGDWYDTPLLPSKEVLLVVGDVAGHGIEAVTGMIAARNVLRGLAVTGAGPGELLRLLNMALCELVDGVVGTVICGLYDPATRVLRWARAGHLPPVLIRDGQATALPLPGGVLLGMDTVADYEEVTVALQPDDKLLLFTDGLIERRGDSIGDALQEFVTAASASSADRTATDSADRVLASSVSDTDDDACLVVVRIL